MAAKARTRSTAEVKTAGGEPADSLRGFYEQMSLVRAFELRSSEMYARAKIGGYCHLNLGEEATVVGLMAAIEARDYLFTGYRDHGYALLRGLSPERVMAELFGKVTGVSGGRGGSMHLFDQETRLFGGYGIVGGQIPPATGAALALKYQESAGPDAAAVMCLLGDGTTNIGAFHESLNLAGLWKLPIVYVIVNNGLGMGTTVEKASAEPELYKRAASYRMPGVRVDGDDVLAVRDAARDALKQARETRQPVLLEVMCYRLRGHSVVDPARYRSSEDTTIAQQSDPVPSFRTELITAGVLSEADAAAIDEAADARVTEAVTFAEESPEPDPKDLFAYVYATAVANAPSALPGEPVMDAL
ncbi:pyruvate dehydrogenase (acetyl-transferring) E1 component subunit alpha [Cryobacterium luteum]|uniref:Pyruvate dehydrogenase E1 component subunit alpha n=1 Tax=Cryobacterium luteum TaxID=1424661 RepID=A0A1H8AB41_9MICO|nr:pyruvate dehydrogenase (acetyl-transferring) E1 component subunit alpha [Cryobacterium luteum]TFB88430.1 pyruvate dehydrogenase (acetyl-transferring) E1 component subunit alpha [Cryobacterium luteum]SEM66767.1 pyruvate dehydrogenase E1 component alpha subunit [Cryobacterium luteum]